MFAGNKTLMWVCGASRNGIGVEDKERERNRERNRERDAIPPQWLDRRRTTLLRVIFTNKAKRYRPHPGLRNQVPVMRQRPRK